LTKAFTAAEVALLVDSGSVELDAPIRRYVPTFALLDAYRGQNATVRDLLAHRTGLGDTNWLTVNTTLSPAAILERLAFVAPDAGFRERYLYQNTMYMVLGEAIGRVSGLDWSTFTRERVLKPLGMNETTTGPPPPSANAAVPHLVSARVPHVIPPLDIANVAPAGAMYSSASDLAKWLDFQTREGKDGGLLSARMLGEMHSAQTARKADPYLYPDATMVAYGLAWILWDYHGIRIVSHDGAIDGMTAKICLVPSLGIGIVVLANSEYSAVPNVLVYDALPPLAPSPGTTRAGFSER
jgi:CubicO group peptidase (beta-lactamase class C family)